jgi:lipopolysaccharide export system protein LptC
MIKSASLNYFAVIFVILASVLIFWHVNSDRINLVSHTLDPDHHDSYIQGARYHSTDANGNLHQQLQAKSAKHYPYQNSLELSEPEMDFFGPKGEIWHIHAAKGSSTNGRDTVILRDNVLIEHRQSSGSAAVVVTTDNLTVHPNQGTADSDALVTITYPQIVLRGKGLHGDMKAGTLKLLTQISGQYEPPAKSPPRGPSARKAPQLNTALKSADLPSPAPH